MSLSLIVAIGFIGFVFLITIVIYNSLVSKKNEVENAQGGLDAQLKQRYDLIPNLVATVREFMQHEKGVLERIVELRTAALKKSISPKQKEKINKEISTNLSGLMVQVEQYPDLKSNTNFVNLQNTLYEVEENIAASRRFYNSAVTDYNNSIEMFPSNIFAKVFNYKRKEVFNIPEIERKNVNVKSLFQS